MARTDRRSFRLGLVAVAALALAATAVRPVQAQDGAAPGRPAGLSTVVSHDLVTLSWDDPGDGTVTGYVILRRDKDIHPQGTFITLVPDTGSAATSYVDAGVDPGRRYVYRIKAINAAGTSDRSSWVRAYTPEAPEPSPQRPAKPTGLISVFTHDSVTLSWDDPRDGAATGYVILRRDKDIHPGGTFQTITADTGTAATTYTDHSAEPERRYVYRVKAINAAGFSDISKWVRAYTPPEPQPQPEPEPDREPEPEPEPEPRLPLAPAGLEAEASPDSVALSWDDPGDASVTHYEVWRRAWAPGERFSLVAADTGTPAASYVDVSVRPERGYVYRVRAVSAAGVSPFSAEARVGTPPEPVWLAGSGVVWSAVLTVDGDGLGTAAWGYSSWTGAGVLSPSVVEVSGRRVSVQVVAVAGRGASRRLYLGTADPIAGGVLGVGPDRFALADARQIRGGGWVYEWSAPGLDWSDGDEVAVSLWAAPAAPSEARLQMLSLSGMADPGFSEGRTRYEIDRAPRAATTTVHARGAAGRTTVSVRAVRAQGDLALDAADADPAQPGHQARLSATGPTLIVIAAGSSDAGRQRVYTVRVTTTSAPPDTPGPGTKSGAGLGPRAAGASDAALSALGLAGAELDPAFAATTHEYAVSVTADTAEVTVTAAAAGAGAEVLISPADADPDTPGHQIALAAASPGGAPARTPIIVVVRSADATALESYVVTVERAAPPSADATLGALSVDGASLDPAFDPDTPAYTATATADATEVTVAATANHPGAEVSVTPADADPDTAGHQITLAQGGATIVTVTVTAEDDTTTGTYTVTVKRAPAADDATLGELSLAGAALAPAFDPDTHSYTADAPAGRLQVTLTARSSHPDAAVVISPADADDGTPGHQVALAEPQPGSEPAQTLIAIAVTSQDTTARRTYVIQISQTAPAGDDARVEFARNESFDLNDLESEIYVDYWTAGDPWISTDIWSDGETWYVGYWGFGSIPEAILAYDFETGARKPSSDILTPNSRATRNHALQGIWSDGEVMLATDMWKACVFEYSLDEGSYGSHLDDFLPEHDHFCWSLGDRLAERSGQHRVEGEARGIWSDGTTVWVASIHDGVVYAYDRQTRRPAYGKDIGALEDSGNSAPFGLWSDGTTLWVSDRDDRKIYAYDMLAGTRQAELDFDTLDDAGNDSPAGLWSDGETMWVADYDDAKVYAYNMPDLRRLASLTVSGVDIGRRGQHEYAGRVGSGVDSVTVDAEPVVATGSVTLGAEDDDPDTEGHQWALAAGENTLSVRVSNGAGTTDYRIVVRKLDTAELDDGARLSDLTLSGIDLDGFSGDTRSYKAAVADLDATTITATPADGMAAVEFIAEDADPDTAGHQQRLRPGANYIRVLVRSWDRTAEHTYKVVVTRWTDADYGWNPLKDHNLWGTYYYDLHEAWSDGETMWIADAGHNRLHAYDLGTQARTPSENFNLGGARDSVFGLWSDGETMWVTDRWGWGVLAYDMETKARKPEEDFGDRLGLGIWSDGITMWAVGPSRGDKQILAYDLRTKARKPEEDFKGSVSHASGALWSDGVTMWVAFEGGRGLRAYDLETKARDRSKDFDLALARGLGSPAGAWSDNETMWVLDNADRKLYAFNMPQLPRLEALEVSGADVRRVSSRRYAGTVDSDVAAVTVVAEPAHGHHEVVFSSDDADSEAEGHQWALAPGENTLSVSVSDGTDTVVYTVEVLKLTE